MTLDTYINQGIKTTNGFVCRNDKTVKDMLMSFDSIITHISFDNDIASYDDNGNEITGYTLVKWLCDYVLDNGLDIFNLTLSFHTANPVGRLNMMCYWNNFKDNYCATYSKEG